VIGVDGMAQAECVGQERGRKQRRAIRQRYERPCPGERVRGRASRRWRRSCSCFSLARR
jgi:hypothetical protein